LLELFICSSSWPRVAGFSPAAPLSRLLAGPFVLPGSTGLRKMATGHVGRNPQLASG